MEWSQFALLLISISGAWVWTRTEANSDRREIMSLIRSIQEEIKDFHGRLCAIEERYRQK